MKSLKLKYVEKFTTFNNKPKWFLKIVSLCLTTNYIKFHTQYGHRFYSLILNASTSTNLWIKANSLWCIMTKSSVFFFKRHEKTRIEKKTRNYVRLLEIECWAHFFQIFSHFTCIYFCSLSIHIVRSFFSVTMFLFAIQLLKLEKITKAIIFWEPKKKKI